MDTNWTTIVVVATRVTIPANVQRCCTFIGFEFKSTSWKRISVHANSRVTSLRDSDKVQGRPGVARAKRVSIRT